MTNYSKELEKVMLEDNIYIVRLSIPSIDMVDKYFSDEFVDDLYNEKLLDNDVLLVRTGESVDYVREILTNKKIPILYSKSIDFREPMENLFKIQPVNPLFKIEISDLKPYFIKAFQHYSSIINFNEKCNIKSFDEKLLEEIKEYYRDIHSDIEKYSEELDNMFSFYNDNFSRIYYEYNLNNDLNSMKKKLEELQKAIKAEKFKLDFNRSNNNIMENINEDFNSVNTKLIEVKDTYEKIISTCECDKCNGKHILYRNTDEPVEEWENPYVERSNVLDAPIKNFIFSRKYITCDKCAGTGIQYCYNISELGLSQLVENEDSSKKEKSILKRIFKVKKDTYKS